MERSLLRKPRQCFDTGVHPSHVTFDDGQQRRNLPWIHYIEACWTYAEPDVIKVMIGDWLVVITGHNLAPLFTAIEEHTLVRIRAQPEHQGNSERDVDAFATEIRFLPAASVLKRKGQAEFEFSE